MSAPERVTWAYRQTVQTAGGYRDDVREVAGPLFHGGRVGRGPGDGLVIGQRCNSWGDEGPRSSHIYFTTDLGTAVAYAEACGSRGAVYEVEPSGEFRSDYGGADFKTAAPMRVVREVSRGEWTG